MKVARKLIYHFLDDIPANKNDNNMEIILYIKAKKLRNLEVENVSYEYKNNEANTNFMVGPII
jgi:hypothetical protein